MDPDPQDIAARYIACWNERDPERRRALLHALWTEDATYIDPLMRSDGREGIGALIKGVQARFPDYRFVVTGRPDGHADRVRFTWALGSVGGAPTSRSSRRTVACAN